MISVTIVVILLGIILYFWLNLHVKYVRIQTKFGQIDGFKAKSRDGREYSSFVGIPYAQPPVGNLRFQPPEPVGSWEGIKDGTKFPPQCPQFDVIWMKVDGEEDCLYLNVYTPKTKLGGGSKKDLLPVIVFIHGGHFMFGGSNIYGAQYFMDEDVVLVTINYRVGALGFLNTGPEARGNMGLKDQNMALMWVHETIKDFGGDPDSVTLMGESAGGSSVNYHMISPTSDGLFHRAISQGGTALCPWAFTPNPNERGMRLGAKVGCPTDSVKALMTCLREIDASKLADAHAEMRESFHNPDAAFGPSVEFESGTEDDVFLFENPRDSVLDGQLARIPWLLGVNKDEGCFKSAFLINNETELDQLNQNWKKVAPFNLLYEEDDIISTQIKNWYFKNKKLSPDDYEIITRMYSDRYFFHCTHDAAKAHAKDSPTYLYEMTYNSGNSVGLARVAAQGKFPVYLEIIAAFLKHRVKEILGLKLNDYGVCRGDELQYLFSIISFWDIGKNSKHYKFSKELIKLWVEFAKEGKPPKFRNVEWEKVNPENGLQYFLLGEEPQMSPERFTEGIEFWRSLYV